jgi:hypothetical protein
MPESKPPKGQILKDILPETFYFIREEEISRAGAILERNWQCVRWLNGKIFT